MVQSSGDNPCFRPGVMGIEAAILQISNGEGLEINVCPISGSFSPILPIDFCYS